MRRVFVALVFITSLAYQTGAVPVPIYSEDVIWTNFVNTSARGNTLIKNSVTTTGGAASVQSIPSGDGFVEFTVSEEASNRAVGLSHGDDGPALEDIDFAIRLNGSGRGEFDRFAECLENGWWIGETPYTAGDVFRVEVTGGRVLYKKNGTTFCESRQPALVYPLLVDTFMDTPGSTISDVVIGGAPSTALSTLYPGDVGIEKHPDVIFVEMFEEETLPALFARWPSRRNEPAISFSSGDVPPGSAGKQSLEIRGDDGNGGGGLFRRFNPDFDPVWNPVPVAPVDDTLYVRFYVKYPPDDPQTSLQPYDHSGVSMGGYNPPSDWPNGVANTLPNGADFFIAAAEQTTTTLDGFRTFNDYDYWMGMRPDGVGSYYGNWLTSSAQATKGQWMCVEQMVRLNNPVTASNGEQATWIDGVNVSHLGPGFPRGRWLNGGIFIPDLAGAPFEGFQWRNDANLDLNWIWLQNYIKAPRVGASLKFDHLVVAKSRIGCLTK